MPSLTGRSLLTLWDLSPKEILALLDLSLRLKDERANGLRARRLEGYTIALLFEKRSTRTRSAFETAFGEEGGHASFLSTLDVHLGTKEDIEDTARVLGRMFDCIQFRGFKQEYVEALAEHSGVPVYNGLTDLYHPTQALADLMTLAEAGGATADSGCAESLDGTRIAYVGDGRNNVAHSLMIAGAKLGISVAIGAPESLQPAPDFVARCRETAASAAGGSGSKAEFVVTENPNEAVGGADAVYTDVWASMGEEAEFESRSALLRGFQVNEDLMAATGKNNAIFLHCLPAQKGNEVSREVFEGSASRVFDQAENRKHTIKATILATLGLALLPD